RRGHLVVGRVGLAGAVPVLGGQTGPGGAVDPVAVEVPAAAAAGAPDFVAELALQFGVELVLHRLPDVEVADVAAQQRAQAAHHVVELAFDHEHYRVVPEAGVGPQQEEQVGEAGHGDAQVGLHAFAPGVLELAAVAADDVEVVEGVGDVEAGAEDDGVDFAFFAVLGDDRVLGDLGYAVGDQLHVGPVERRVVVAGEQDPLAADRVVGRDGFAQLRVLDDFADVALGQPFGQPRGAPLEDEQVAQFEQPAHGVAGEPLHRQDAADQARQAHRHGAVGVGLWPRRGALEEVQYDGSVRDLGNELHGAGPGADDRRLRPCQVLVVVPLGGVEDLAG